MAMLPTYGLRRMQVHTRSRCIWNSKLKCRQLFSHRHFVRRRRMRWSQEALEVIEVCWPKVNDFYCYISGRLHLSVRVLFIFLPWNCSQKIILPHLLRRSIASTNGHTMAETLRYYLGGVITLRVKLRLLSLAVRKSKWEV